MMLSDNAVDQVNRILDDPDFPWNKLKSMKLYWIFVDGQGNGFWLPVLETEFYETEEEKSNWNESKWTRKEVKNCG